jgi:hypothetical protein
MELRAALSGMVDRIADDDAGSFFDAVNKAIDASSDDEDEDMRNNDKVEEKIRRKIRQYLGEAAGAYTDSGMSYSGPMTGARRAPEGNETCETCQGDGEDEMGNSCKACRGKGYVASSKRGYEKEGEESLEKLAQKFGYSKPSGVRQFINRTMDGFKKKFEMNRDDPDALDILIFQGINDYIEYLKSSGELTPADVQLLKDHPSIVWSMPDAQEHVANYISSNM